MYIIKNALRCITRSPGRNVLIGIIVLVISVSACLGLSIRQAAESARIETMEGLSVTATISFDRQNMMSQMTPPTDGDFNGGFDRDSFAEQMQGASGLTLEEYQTYAKSQYVKDFTYSLSASFNGSDTLSPVTTETESESSSQTSDMMGGMMGDKMGGMMGGMPGGNRFGNFGDFSLVGYGSKTAMTDFQQGTSTVTDGSVFDEDTSALDCMISQELATYNDLSVDDVITVTDVDDETITYELTVVGIYTNSSSNADSFDRFTMSATDPANQIYLSYNALQTMLDEDGTGSLSATYSFASTNDYYAFAEAVYDMGLDESYTVSSTDLESFEQSLVPLETLSTMAGTFLIVILIIGAVILVVLNIFNVRERKYEIGVLTAMGMKKSKVALQFLTEIFAVTMIAVFLGAGIGAVGSVPVTNALLENQISSQNDRSEQIEQNFGLGNMPGGEQMPQMGNTPPSGGGDFKMNFDDLFGGGENSYVTSVSSAMNLTVLVQMMGIAVLLTLVGGSVSMLFVMRYEPLKILANRD